MKWIGCITLTDKFETQIDKFVVDTQEKMLAVMRTSIDAVVKETQLPRKQGGRMRVDTGFLRWSGVSALNQIPRGPIRGRKRGKLDPKEGMLAEYAGDGGKAVVTNLSRMKIGDVFYFGWTAHYARYREAYDGFLAAALQNWQTHVNNAVKRLKK